MDEPTPAGGYRISDRGESRPSGTDRESASEVQRRPTTPLGGQGEKTGRQTLGQVATITAPETLLTWHRTLIDGNQAGKARRSPGRPPTGREIAALAVRIAEENRSWGYRRIQGALANLGHDLAHNTVRSILKRHGIEPSPERARKTTWREFLQRHWEQIVTSDFFGAEVSKGCRLASLVALCFMKLSTHDADIERAADETDVPPTIQLLHTVTKDTQGLCDRRRDRARSRTHCRYRTEPSVGKLDKRLILPFSSNQAKKLNRHQSAIDC
ncbi:MAG: hypothetical protein DMF73_03860 [Acidobacteria bacterium]|nr:MAG: hypothetical protein DMF73_03860 [Acidobacteriota bacterium]